MNITHRLSQRTAATTVTYLTRIPRQPPPAGRIVVHNHVEPARPLGRNGFRAWTDDASDRYERCDCDWAVGRLAEHYRVRCSLR